LQSIPTLVSELRDADPKKRVRALKRLEWIGPDADPALGAIFELLRDPVAEVAKAAAQTSICIGVRTPSSTADLVQKLGSSRLEDRRRAAFEATRLQGAADRVAPLATALTDRDPIVRTFAATALNHWLTNSHAGVDALLNAVDDPDVPARRSVYEALANHAGWWQGKTGRIPVDRVGPLRACALKALQDPAVKLSGISILVHLGLQGEDVVPTLEHLLRDPDPAVRSAAERAIKEVTHR
jgi:HEAT repeat protein